MLGRWKRKGGKGGSSPSDAPDLKGGDDDSKPNLDSPLAPKLVGRWKGKADRGKDPSVEFTKAGKVTLTITPKPKLGRHKSKRFTIRIRFRPTGGLTRTKTLSVNLTRS